MDQEFETGVNDQAAADIDQDEQFEGDSVPVSVVQKMRQEQRALKESMEELKQERALYRAQLMNQQQPQAQAPRNPLDDIPDDEVMTGADLKKIVPALMGPFAQAINEAKVTGKNPDFQDVITKHLPKVLEKRPHLARLIQTSQDPLTLAYEIGITDPAYGQKKNEEGFSDRSKKAADNARKPGSLGSIKGPGSQRSEEHYSNMSDDDIEKQIQKVMYGKK
jgi:hypothetical protein